MALTAQVYVPTRGFVYCETAKALEPYNPSYVRDKVAIGPARNWIARDYLTNSTADLLVMVDDDVVPPARFVERLAGSIGITGFQVVAGVVPITGAGKPFFPNAFKHVDGKYVAMLDNIKPDRANAADAVGTGCIAIHRSVIERIERPFDCGYDQAGVIDEGEDLGFCRRAREHGFKVAAHFGVLCEHFTPVHANGLHAAYATAFTSNQEGTRDA